MTFWEVTWGLCDELFFSIHCVDANCFPVFTSNGPTVIMPTWFCSRAWFAHVGPFDEGGQVSTALGFPPTPWACREGL